MNKNLKRNCNRTKNSSKKLTFWRERKNAADFDIRLNCFLIEQISFDTDF